MASRSFKPGPQTLEQEVKILYGSAVIGASGAVGTVKGGGIESVTRVSAGRYRIQLEDQYTRLLASQCSILSSAANAVCSIQGIGDPSTLQSVFKAQKVFDILCKDSDGAAVDPDSGSVLNIVVHVRNSVIGPFD